VCCLLQVETVGSVYVVVSGMPHRNGDRHRDVIVVMTVTSSRSTSPSSQRQGRNFRPNV